MPPSDKALKTPSDAAASSAPTSAVAVQLVASVETKEAPPQQPVAAAVESGTTADADAAPQPLAAAVPIVVSEPEAKEDTIAPTEPTATEAEATAETLPIVEPTAVMVVEKDEAKPVAAPESVPVATTTTTTPAAHTKPSELQEKVIISATPPPPAESTAKKSAAEESSSAAAPKEELTVAAEAKPSGADNSAAAAASGDANLQRYYLATHTLSQGFHSLLLTLTRACVSVCYAEDENQTRPVSSHFYIRRNVLSGCCCWCLV